MDKKLIAVFRSFVEKVFLPVVKKTEPVFLEWSKFNQLLSIETNSYDEVAQYVDSLGGSSTNSFSSLDKREVPLFKKRTPEPDTSNGDGSFNPSKTFGGERARMMFMKGEMDDYSEPRQPGFGFGSARSNLDPKQTQTTPQAILPGLERLCKAFVENQGRIENILGGVKPIVTNKYG